MQRLALAILLAVSPLAGGAHAQPFPDRPITLVNPYAAGGPADLLARTVAEGMSEVLGRPVVVDNRPGAGTAIGARAVAQAKPDGYTLFIGGSPSHVITPALMKDAGYDGIAAFTPIATVADVPNVLIVPPSRMAACITSSNACRARSSEAGSVASYTMIGWVLPSPACAITEIITKKWKCASIAPPARWTRMAEAVSRPRLADAARARNGRRVDVAAIAHGRSAADSTSACPTPLPVRRAKATRTMIVA